MTDRHRYIDKDNKYSSPSPYHPHPLSRSLLFLILLFHAPLPFLPFSLSPLTPNPPSSSNPLSGASCQDGRPPPLHTPPSSFQARHGSRGVPWKGGGGGGGGCEGGGGMPEASFERVVGVGCVREGGDARGLLWKGVGV